MAGVVDQGGEVPGYTVPLHRALMLLPLIVRFTIPGTSLP